MPGSWFLLSIYILSHIVVALLSYEVFFVDWKELLHINNILLISFDCNISSNIISFYCLYICNVLNIDQTQILGVFYIFKKYIYFLLKYS